MRGFCRSGAQLAENSPGPLLGMELIRRQSLKQQRITDAHEFDSHKLFPSDYIVITLAPRGANLIRSYCSMGDKFNSVFFLRSHRYGSATGIAIMVGRMEPVKKSRGRLPRKLSGCRDVFGDGARLGNRVSVFPHAGQVHLNGFAHQLGSFFHGGASGDASWKVRNVRAVATSGLFEQNGVSHHFNPACFRMLFRVFGSRSIEGWPAIVTRPFLVGCLYWQWLPPKFARSHP